MSGHKRPSFNEIINFGPFRLRAAERLLERDGVAVSLGSRALDILITLVERASEVVDKRDLIARVWPDLVVDEGSLRFHIAVLRKALGDGVSGARYVSNVAGRGYCFVAPVSRTTAEAAATDGVAWQRPTDLPTRPWQMLGRDEAVHEVSDRLRSHRFVSVVGSGGIGKTTVAVSVAHAMRREFGGAVYFLDLGPLDDPLLSFRALASALGLPVNTEVSLPILLRFFRDRRALLVLDSCEHVMEEVAALAELLFRECPQLHILSTSRESLRVEGERVLHLPPLSCPPDTPQLKASEALAFPAVRLFVDCIAASGYAFELTDAEAPLVGEICRRLDGVALALELIAGRVGVYGIRGTAALLDSPFRLFWQGRRPGPRRHQT
ncbi:MAG TPA: winged helix-turn-helix domain-containing protein, partial [Steroidobacteraceae bacterium]